MTSPRFLPLFSSAVWCAANALAASVIRPVGVNLTGADEFFPASHLINGSGLEFRLDTGDPLPAACRHWWSDPTSDAWTSSDAGGLLSATFGGPAVSVTMDHGTINETPAGFMLPVSHISDLAGNGIAPGSQRSFTSGVPAGLGRFLFANRIPLSTPPIDSRVFYGDCATPLAGTAFWTQAYVKLDSDPDDKYQPVGSPVHFRTGGAAGNIRPVVVTTPFPAEPR